MITVSNRFGSISSVVNIENNVIFSLSQIAESVEQVLGVLLDHTLYCPSRRLSTSFFFSYRLVHYVHITYVMSAYITFLLVWFYQNCRGVVRTNSDKNS